MSSLSKKLYVLCGSAQVVPGVVIGQENRELQVKYVYQKTECTATYVPCETFVFSGGQQVQLCTLAHASTPCTLALPSPFNQKLKLGSTLLFVVDGGLDFVALWNDCCAKSVTWQHNRPKKTADLLQKLGLPAKLSDYLREQVVHYGMEVPLGSDASDEEAAVNESLDSGDLSSHSSSSRSASEAENSDDYYSSLEDDDAQEDLEEEEEVEDEPEPEELLDDE